jgi:O-antigen ligase/Flp pilus assembly protein TadD
VFFIDLSRLGARKNECGPFPCDKISLFKGGILRKLLAIPERLTLPSSSAGRLFGVVLCLVMVGTTLVPSRSVDVWLVRDLALRWTAVLLFGLAVLNQWGREAETGVRLDVFDLLALSGLGWVTLSAWNSDQPFDAFYALRGFWALVLMWFALRIAWRRWPELFSWWMAFFLGTALVGSFWVTLQTGFNHFIPIEGPFTNINFAAAFIGAALLLVLARYGRGGGGLSILPLMAIFFIAWVAARSRGSLVALVIALAIYLALHAREFEEKLSRWSVRQWWIAGAVVLLMASMTAPMVDRLMHAGERDPRAYWRVLIWESSWNMASDHPLLGVGPGVYGTYYPYYRPAQVWFNENPFAHNEYLQAAAEAGWPGLIWALLGMGTLLLALARRSRKWTDASTNVLDRQTADAALLVVLMFAIHASLDFVLHEWCVTLILLALATFALRDPVDLGVNVTFRFSKSVRWIFILGLGLGLVWMMGVGSLRDEKAQHLHIQALRVGMAGDAGGAEALEQRALDFAPRYATAWNTLAYLSNYLAQKTENPAKQATLVQQAADRYREALERAPHDVTLRENQIEFYMANKAWVRALELQKGLTDEAPRHLPNYPRQAEILMALGRPQEAVATCELALQKKSTYLPAVLAQIDAFLKMGRVDQAREAARRALEVPPDITEPFEMVSLRQRLAAIAKDLQPRAKGK